MVIVQLFLLASFLSVQGQYVPEDCTLCGSGEDAHTVGWVAKICYDADNNELKGNSLDDGVQGAHGKRQCMENGFTYQKLKCETLIGGMGPFVDCATVSKNF